MRRLIIFVCLVAVAVAGTACNEEGSVNVRNLEFKGTEAIPPSRLKAVLATKQSSKIPWGKKNFFDRSRFDADLKRIEVFYADRGYPDARVTGFDVKLNDKQDAVDVTLTISEGEPIRIAAVTFEGFEVIPPNHLEDLRKRMPLSIGEARDRQEIVGTHELAVNELRDHGYPYSKVTTDENDGADGKTAVITFKAEPGVVAYFGSVEISGNQSVANRVIERQVTFKPGDLYRRSVVQDTQRRLYSLELFQFVNVESLNPEQQSEEVRTRITVAEGKHQRVNFGVGYGTEEKARVDAQYHHVNFLGGARSAGARARYSSLDRGIRLDFNQPYLLGPRSSLGGEAQHWLTYTPAYQSMVTGAKATWTYKRTPRLSWAASLISERQVSSINPKVKDDPSLRSSLIALGFNPDTLEQAGTLNGVGFDLQRSTADNVLNPRRGYQLTLHAESAGRFLPGNYTYAALSGDMRHYVPIGERLVIANRVQAGNINPAANDETQIPFAKKYFLGGAGSVRGWGRFELSPISESGLPIGGNTLFAFSSEARMTLLGNVGGVLFLDGGNVWANGGPQLDNLRYAIGPGLRYQTPIGPVRFDLGYQLNPIDGLVVNGEPQQRRWRIHFSIGQAF
jgi:outer membrane protein assembly complex protein YaeT